ncbi:MAG: nucleotidyltransferase domain-containing protein [Cycloclasticus sp.]|nr:nucleotidyltransferase domain-containing protein [Cycloclasticus sp.]
MKDNMLVKHYAGSIAYGTNLPTSDVDFRGIFCADPINILTPFYAVRECEDNTEEDTKLFELSHFMKLAIDCNPNVVESLWVDESDITHSTPAYEFLRSHRHELLSKKIAFTTSGYALSQLKRIKGHNKWINNPQPERAPFQTDYMTMVFNLEDHKMFKRDFNLEDFYEDHRLIPYGGDVYGLYEAPGYNPYTLESHNINTLFDAGDGFHTIAYKHEWLISLGEFLGGKQAPRRRRPIAIVKFNKEQ